MKKILIVANVAKEHVLKFHIPTIKMLKEDGWVVHVACAGQEEIPYSDKSYHMTYGRNPLNVNTFKSINILKKIIDTENYDIIHCHTPTGGIVARLASKSARKHGTKVIYTAHGYHFFKGAPLLNWLLFFPIEWFLSFVTDCIITINDEDYCNTKRFKFGTKQIRKIDGVGIPIEKFRLNNKASTRTEYRKLLGISQNTLVLIYVAELIPNKNQGFLIQMFSELVKYIDDCALVLVGPDHVNGEYNRLITDLNLENQIKLLGWRNDIPELLACSDICVASSIREGFGLNLIEAMTIGIPVVALRNRGHCQIIKDGYSGYIIEQGDYKEMISKILMLHNNEILSQKIVLNAKLDINRYSSDSILENLKTVYDEIIIN